MYSGPERLARDRCILWFHQLSYQRSDWIVMNLKTLSHLWPYLGTVEPFLHLNAFSNRWDRFCISLRMHWRSFSMHFKTSAMFPNETELQNVCNALSNIDNAFPRNSLALRSIHTLCLLTFRLKLKTKCNSKNAVVIVIWENTKLFRFTRSGSN